MAWATPMCPWAVVLTTALSPSRPCPHCKLALVGLTRVMSHGGRVRVWTPRLCGPPGPRCFILLVLFTFRSSCVCYNYMPKRISFFSPPAPPPTASSSSAGCE